MTYDPHAEALAPTTEVDGSTDVELDPFSWHEALDRTHMINVILESLLLEHPVIDQHIEFLELAEKASYALHDLYQAIGRASPDHAISSRFTLTKSQIIEAAAAHHDMLVVIDELSTFTPPTKSEILKAVATQHGMPVVEHKVIREDPTNFFPDR